MIAEEESDKTLDHIYAYIQHSFRSGPLIIVLTFPNRGHFEQELNQYFFVEDIYSSIFQTIYICTRIYTYI